MDGNCYAWLQFRQVFGPLDPSCLSEKICQELCHGLLVIPVLIGLDRAELIDISSRVLRWMTYKGLNLFSVV
jgi:hypothetical protein